MKDTPRNPDRVTLEPVFRRYEADPLWGCERVLGNPYYRRELALLAQTAGERPIEHLLDVGAGFGRASSALLATARRVLLLDGSLRMLRQSPGDRDAPARRLRVRGDISRAWPVRPEAFDLAVGLQILNHMPDLTAFFAELRRALVPGGRAILSFGNARSWIEAKERLREGLGRLVRGRNPFSPFLASVEERIRVHGFCRHSPATVFAACRAAGLSVRIAGAAGLASPVRRLAGLDRLTRFPLFRGLSHLVLIECAKPG
ncbi:MAG: methyltransferase domain-containing protein [Planctomycetes bacterium]|nr:methyltransferase domain-containing protein [Planctomycetota bacterium]